MENRCTPTISTNVPLTATEGAVREFVRYGLVSALALAVDSGLLIALHQLGVSLAMAAATGFLSGLVLVYLLSIRWVFSSRSVHDRRAEFIIFLAIGLAGLVLTEILLHWLSFYLMLGYAKVATAGFVFIFNFSMRKLLLFVAKH